jgi:hypothetical protein
MSRNFIGLIVFLFSFSALSQSKEVKEVLDCMQQQESAWNNFSIEGFMNYYWNSDSLMFIGSKGITFGWKQTLENYKKNYKTPELMGVLTFTNLSAEKISDDAVYIIGRWQIQRKELAIGGNYSLLWRKLNGKWVITRDHTS